MIFYLCNYRIKTNKEKYPSKFIYRVTSILYETVHTNFSINSYSLFDIQNRSSKDVPRLYINTLYILCILIASLFLPLRRSTVTNRVVSFLPTSLVYPSFIVRFPRATSHLRGRRGKREGGGGGRGQSPRGCPSRSPRRFKLLMSIFRLVTLSELVHRRRCVLPIKVFNESERKMAPARPR